jgi:drug resistance transporter, EmrB/QacA subfamily
VATQSSTSQTTESDARPDSPTPPTSPWTRWIIALTVSFAALLEILDTSIVNVALPYMQGNLGATLSEIGWVVTGYAVANAIIIPLSAWLGDVFGRRNYFLFSLAGFVLSSILCGVANSLTLLVAARILQGLTGGGLLAKAQSVLFEVFPPNEQGLAQALFGVGVLVGPVIGPTLGGYLTDTLGWRWIFFINIPFGLLAIAMSWYFFPKDHAKQKQASVDWVGILLLIVAIGSLQTFLEEGNQEDWFSSPMIIVLAITAVVGLVVFIVKELRTPHPAVDLRVLRHKSLAAGSVFSFILGMGLYGAMFAIPIFVQSILHFTAMQTGLLMVPSALASALMMPVLGKLTNKIDPRILIAIGSAGTAVVLWQLSSINPQTGADQFFWPLLLRGAFTVFLYMPLSMAALGPLPKADIPAATGFYNLTRQLGGSVGVALLTTFLSQQENQHRARLVENINEYNPAFTQMLSNLSANFQMHGFDAATAQQQAMKMIEGMVTVQSTILSFADIFRAVAILFALALPLVFLLGKRTSAQPIEAH